MITAAQAIVDCLRREDIDHVFARRPRSGSSLPVKLARPKEAVMAAVGDMG
jgi:thiamine pyrophosphate-dependent acetolactate synthase large subunit-like protein